MKFIIERKVLISMLFLGLTVLGYVSYRQLPVELLPNAELPFLFVQANSVTDLAPEYMENQVTIPIEGAIGTLEGIESIESNVTSKQSSIVVYYQKDVNFKYAYLKLQEKINGIQSSMPSGVRVNVIKADVKQLQNSRFMELQARGEGGVDRVRTIVEQDIKADLENIDGIASVNVYGGKQKSIQVILDTKACEAYHITPAKIRSLLAQNNGSRTYVGNLKEKTVQYFVHVTAEYTRVEDLENLVVASGPILLKDVAEVRFGEKEETSFSRVNGKDAVTILLVNDSQANLIDLSKATRKVVARLNEKMAPKEIEIAEISNSADQMETNVDQIIDLAIVGGIMAIFVLWIFLKNLRIVSFIAVAIPISIFTSFNFFYAFGITLNSLTLVGMALAIGMLLDNSVVVLENIYRLAGKGAPPLQAVVQGTTEVWRSILASTLTTITVFLPFIFSKNFMVVMIGYNVGVSIVSTILVSLAVALLLVPMASYALLKKRVAKNIFFEKVTTNLRMVQVYLVFLKSSMRFPAATIIGGIAAFFLAVFISLAVSISSLQEVENKEINLYVTMPSGSSLETTDRTVQEIEKKLEDLSEKQDVISKIEEEQATVTVKLKDKFEEVANRTFAQIKTDINERTRNIKASSISFTQTQNTRSFQGGSRNMMGSFQKMMGIGSDEEKIVLKGQDFKKLQAVGEDLKYFVDQLESVQSVNLNISDNRPEVHLYFNPLLMTEYNITLSNVLSELNSFSKEISTGIQYKQGVDEYEIIITQKEPAEDEQKADRNMEELKMVQVSDASGGVHDLQDFTNIVYASGLSGINRVNQEKQIELTYRFVSEASNSKDLLAAYRYEIDELVANYNLPSGVAAEVVHDETDYSEFYFMIGAAIVLIFMIMASVFESVATPFVLLFSIPLAAIGSLLALIITNNSLLNSNTLIGFLILLGVVVNNGIILIDYTNILRKRGFRRSRALMTAGLSRVRPILITAITTIVGMFPLAMGNAEYVSAIGAPFAIVVIGGLALSTVLTLVFIPTFYSGLENALDWFKEQTLRIKIVQFALMAASFLLIFLKVDSGLWQMLDFVLVVILVPGSTWFVLNSLRKAQTKLIGDQEAIVIRIQNLVKIYDRESRFSREWEAGKKIRRRAGLEKQYHTLREFDYLIWQLPVLGFLCYFSFIYLDAAFWSLWLSVAIANLALSIWKPFGFFLNFRAAKTGRKRLVGMYNRVRFFLFWILPAIEAILVWRAAKTLGLVVTFGILWYLALVISVTARKLYEEKINIDRITGRFGTMRRGLLRTVKKIPVIGRQHQPFKALNGVSLEITTGMFGLLGPNGAGKSTMMRIICGILEQSYGKIWINGIDTQEKREELQGLIGYLPQEFGTYENMPARDFLDYQAILKGITDERQRNDRIEYVLKAVHMWEKRADKIGSFSGGMKQRIGIAQILLHLPKILVVDEPTAGLDPRERIRFRNLLVELSRERVVIFSTHIIEDISSSCNQVAVIDRGRVKYHGTPMDMVHLAKDMIWQYDISVDEFDRMENKQLVTHHMKQGELIRVRFLSKQKPTADAVPVSPILEDAYLCLIKDLK